MENEKENYFSIRNNKIHKVLTILGIKFKFKNHNKAYTELLKTVSAEIKSLRKEQYELHRKIARVTPMSKLRNFEVHIAEHCNLNCQCCNHYSPLAKEEFLDIEVFKKDLERMAQLTNSEVKYINLLGGEPLLHPQLVEFFKIARNLFPTNTRLNLVTNGILLNQQKQNFWDACKENNITLAITQYPINLNIERIKETAKINNVKIAWGYEDGQIKHSWFFPINLDGNLDAKENFINCRDANNCIFLRDGKLFTCVVPPNIHHFNKYFNKKIPVTERDYIYIV